MRSLLLVFALLLVLEIAIVIVAFSESTIVNAIDREYDGWVSWMGENRAEKLSIEAGNRYNNWFVDTGMRETTIYFFVPRNDNPERMMGMEKVGDGIFTIFISRMEVIWELIRQTVFRITLILFWGPYMLPLLIPAIIDGWAKREIKKFSYGYSSPVWYHSAFHGMVLLIFLLLMYLLLPVALPAWLVPVWLALFTLSVYGLVSNMAKML